MIISTPDNDPSFFWTLHSSLPPGWKQEVDSDFSRIFGVDATTGLLKPLSEDQLEEYIEGGEEDEALGLDEDFNDDFFF